MHGTSLKLPEKLVEKIDEEADRQGRSRSEIIRSKLAGVYFE